ncbi:5-formyltetrahydrofolate cyclo-ligase [Thiomicrorhabdus lithotrophica]|uniref:5-formyltetrahydrofolate cyclo-ligase n=1 Tax=Thiomicrorhabdus lithotrophica TaxID=2949997 RepID=A0ABY8CCC6_9GAMM|nr:5-formyltetrahydrofolate cyclo-ligase [Thiomicrorhabdus lithotrophica]WEJ61773.1 5-formyltetrahydrofolate cyclo-ligase [Thiomicrorhabdus lithotrophica]
MTPAEIRKQLRITRNTLTPSQQSQHAQQALQNFKQLLKTQIDFSRPQKIALFLTQDGELDTHETIEYLWNETEHQIYLPVLETKDEWHMAFVQYTPQSVMLENQFGIKEPYAPTKEHLSGDQLDWVFMPLVAYDKNGNRLGMGGGYYDRTFAFKLNSESHTTKLIGWAHSCQQTESLLPSEPWDVPLDGILTETGYSTF